MIVYCSQITIGGKIHEPSLTSTGRNTYDQDSSINSLPLTKKKICASHAGLTAEKTVVQPRNPRRHWFNDATWNDSQLIPVIYNKQSTALIIMALYLVLGPWPSSRP
jgi:hypothetical protein